MLNLLEILSKESSNTDTIYFYREGVFYKAYERSAYLFVHHVKPFQIKKRFVKSVKREVVTIGFPTNSLYNYFAKEQVVKLENGVKVELDQKIDSADFEQWRTSIPVSEDLPKNTNKENNNLLINATASEKNVAMQVRMFRGVNEGTS